MASPMAKLDNIPKAARATPYIPNKEWEMKAVAANNMTGIMADNYPKASPKIMLVAAPVVQAMATSLTGAYEWEV